MRTGVLETNHLSLPEVMAWCLGKEKLLKSTGFVCEVRKNSDCDNTSITITMDGKGLMAELVIWSAGSIHAEALQSSTGTRWYLKDAEIEGMASLDAETAAFLSLLL
ncbi:hypothetical protein [Niveispirillum sp.]|uniref:immunity protein TriTu family protein n=1 Tax=Niveispirillum sp. TaxID=1917217 RepID=UPI001B62C1B5|nr:hypothetical protein [Niveispirillum sp.]MBP7339155.1 hypothetical protein [Niveispirillum sp.]